MDKNNKNRMFCYKKGGASEKGKSSLYAGIQVLLGKNDEWYEEDKIFFFFFFWKPMSSSKNVWDSDGRKKEGNDTDITRISSGNTLG